VASTGGNLKLLANVAEDFLLVNGRLEITGVIGVLATASCRFVPLSVDILSGNGCENSVGENV
jgi:hypothetical protein